MHFHIREHHWVNGVLSTVEHFFESIERATEHAENSPAHTIKIYDHEGQLYYHRTPDAVEVRPQESYA
jgi:hypothetical protein